MRAIAIARPGGPEVLELREARVPEPRERQIRVRVQATALNRADLLQRRGGYAAPPGAPAEIPGLEYAGVVEVAGTGARRWREGDAVMGLVGGGAYAEYVVVHEDEAIAAPRGMPAHEAAAIPEAFITAHDGFEQLRLGYGETVVIHALPSGVGTAALQLAQARGAAVIGTSRSAWKLERVVELGLAAGGSFHALDLTAEPDWPPRVRALTDGLGAAAVFDLVGGDYLAGNLVAIAQRGRILIVGLVAGSSATLDMRLLLQRRARIGGTVMRARPLDEKIAVAQDFDRQVLGHFEEGRLRPVIDVVMRLEEAAEAHARMEANRNIGKIVLRV
jgi:NADPH:quinone reductase